MNSDPRLVRIIFPIAGAVALVIALITTVEKQHFASNASTTEGKIVKINNKTHFVIEFVPQSGKATQFSTSCFQTYAVGDRVPILYTPDPITGFRAAVNTPVDLWKESVFCSFLGIIFILIGRNTDKIPGWRNDRT